MLQAIIGISERAPRHDATVTINEGREEKGDRRQIEGVPSQSSDYLITPLHQLKDRRGDLLR